MNKDFGDYEESYNIKNVRYVTLSGGGNIYDLKMFGSPYRPSITNLKDVVNSDNADFSWSNPIDPTFKGVKIYRGSELIATVDPKESSYKVSNLEAGKEYDFKFVSIYEKDGNILESETLNKKIKTKMPVIKPPGNVYITPQDKKIVIAWDDVKSPFLQGYNVYVDGKKINDKPLTSNKLIVKNLENDKSYKVQVSAVNKNDVEGEKSKEVSEKPSSDALEVEYDVKMPFDPTDVLGIVMAFLLIVGPLILLGLALKFYKPFITFLYNSIQNKKGRDEK
ncbi:fibronectin type III domain-containing protein [Bacillus cereus group sp. BfR-BA-01312]|uniref:fibronectin type III domain-containing protein n=1 Tax=Bacillus cereus group sp. BfR-BA-01312 TaxID=2920289 RepID=UPI001F579776|nr:fibronectin type III domain-containing protein [Bacillus cereus group sp. BfR-BA-01312]